MIKLWASEGSWCLYLVDNCVVCISELDRDGDGRVSFKDFDFAMKYDVSNHFWFAVHDMQLSPELQQTTNHCDFPCQDVKLFQHLSILDSVGRWTDLLCIINCFVSDAILCVWLSYWFIFVILS